MKTPSAIRVTLTVDAHNRARYLVWCQGVPVAAFDRYPSRLIRGL